MSKLLKLTGIASFISAATLGIVIKRGEVSMFSDEIADKLLKSGRQDKEGERLPYFTEVPEGSQATHIFSTTSSAVAPAEAKDTTPDSLPASKPPLRQRKSASHAV